MLHGDCLPGKIAGTDFYTLTSVRCINLKWKLVPRARKVSVFVYRDANARRSYDVNHGSLFPDLRLPTFIVRRGDANRPGR